MSSYSSWSEAIIFVLVFISVLGLVIVNFNFLYHKDNSLGIVDNSTEQSFINYQGTAQTQIEGGEVDFNALNGITLKSSYGLTKDALNIVWTFLSGGFIENVAGKLNLGQSGIALARGLRIIYFLSLIFGLLYLLFKVVP